MSTRAGRRGDPCNNDGIHVRGGIAPYVSILINNIQIFGGDTDGAPPTFIARTIVTDGMIAFLPSEKIWARCVRYGHDNRFQLPSKIRLIGENGKLSAPIDVNGDEFVHVYYANAFGLPVTGELQKRVDTLEYISGALRQNVDALRQATAIIYRDPELKTQIETAQRARERGETTVSLLQSVGDEIRLENFSTGAVSYVSDLLELWKNTMTEIDALTGRAKVAEKTERRITSEIAVIENAAATSIDVIIDTVNAFATYYGDDVFAARGSAIRAITENAIIGDDTNEPVDDGQGAGNGGN